MAARLPRHGFALLAAVAIVAILAIVATIVTVTLSGDNDQARIETVADELHRLASEIDTTRNGATSMSFMGSLFHYPATLSQLYHRISIADKNCVGVFYRASELGNWKGPYHTVPISPAGHQLAAGFFADNTIVFNPIGARNFTDIAITIQNVSLNDASLLDIFVDRTSNASAGVVTYTPTNSSPVVLSYHIAIPNC